jgi:hypothetical protein
MNILRRSELSSPILAISLLCLLATVTWGETPSSGYSQEDVEKGRSDAKSDLSRGILAYETASRPEPSDDEYVKLLAERYHIEVRRVLGWEIVTDNLSTIIGHMAGYNEIAIPEIENRYGKGILQKVADEARGE